MKRITRVVISLILSTLLVLGICEISIHWQDISGFFYHNSNIQVENDKNLSDLNNKVSSLKDNISSLQERVNSLTDRNNEIKKELENSQEENTQLKATIEQNEAEITQLKSQISTLEALVTTLKATISSLTDENGQLKEENQTLKASVLNLNQQITQLEGQITQLKSDLKALELSSEKIKDLEAQIESLNGTISTLREEIKSLTDENGNLTQEKEQLESSIAGLRSEISSLESQGATLSQQVTDLTSQLDLSKAEVTRLNTQVKSLNENISSLNTTISNLTDENGNLKEENNQLKETIKTLNETVSNLQTQVETLTQQVNALNEEITKLKLPQFSTTFSNNSWATIAAVSSEIYNKKLTYSQIEQDYGWKAGDVKTFDLPNGSTQTVFIIDFNTDEAGITLMTQNLIETQYKMNDTSKNERGYAGSNYNSALAIALNNEFKNLPSDLQNVIKSAHKSCVGKQSSGEISTSYKSLKLWPLSLAEIASKSTIQSFASTNTHLNYYLEEGVVTHYGEEPRQYEYFRQSIGDINVFNTDNAVLKKKLNNGYGGLQYYWLRTPYLNNTTDFMIVNSSGRVVVNYGASAQIGVSYGFCI